jgi:hypothetical protein
VYAFKPDRLDSKKLRQALQGYTGRKVLIREFLGKNILSSDKTTFLAIKISIWNILRAVSQLYFTNNWNYLYKRDWNNYFSWYHVLIIAYLKGDSQFISEQLHITHLIWNSTYCSMHLQSIKNVKFLKFIIRNLIVITIISAIFLSFCSLSWDSLCR